MSSESNSISAIFPVLMHSRIQSKILLELSPQRDIDPSPGALYEHVREVIDTGIFRSDVSSEPFLTTSVKTTVLSALPPGTLSHTQQSSITVAKAVTDKCLDKYGGRPNIDLDDPDVPLQVFLSKGVNSSRDVSCSLYASLLSAQSSHKLRDYRSEKMHTALLKPTTAAALLHRIGWPALSLSPGPPVTLLDPMCGSATFLIEGGLIASDVAPLLKRVTSSSYKPITALRWRSLSSPAHWAAVVSTATSRAAAGLAASRARGLRLVGSDVESESVRLATEGLEAAGLGGVSSVVRGSCDEVDLDSEIGEGTVVRAVVNPPWGGRLEGNLEKAWSKLGTTLRHGKLKGQECWVLSPPTELSGLLKLRKSAQMSFSQADDTLRFVQYLLRS